MHSLLIPTLSVAKNVRACAQAGRQAGRQARFCSARVGCHSGRSQRGELGGELRGRRAAAARPS
eukprot:3082361-Alexandrium_andersonii.AAC.1